VLFHRGVCVRSISGAVVVGLALLVVAHPPARAAEKIWAEGVKPTDLDAMELEDLLDIKVVTASRVEQTLEEAPAIVAIVTRDDIRRYGHRTVGEALRSVPGLAQVDDLVHLNVGVRGIFAPPGSSSEILKLMINGQPVSFRPNSVNAFGSELIPIELVERIEVLRGPASALYGANAFLGVVNVITVDAAQLADGVSTRFLALDGFALQNPAMQTPCGSVSLTAAGRRSGFSYLAGGTFQHANRSGLELPGLSDIVRDDLHDQNPERYPPAEGHPSPGLEPEIRRGYRARGLGEGDLERVGSVYATAAYDIGKAGAVSLDGSFQYLDRYGEFQDFSVLTHRNRISYHNAYARLRYRLAPEQSRCWGNASLTWATGRPNSGEQLVDGRAPQSYKERELGYQAWDAVVEGGCRLFQKHTLSAGFDYTNDRQDLMHLTEHDRETGRTISGRDFGEKTFHTVGGFVQWMWNPVERLGVTLGARADRNSVNACDATAWVCLGRTDDRVFSPEETGWASLTQTDRGLLQVSNRAAVVYTLPWAGLYAKALYGSSFKPPSPFELYHDPMSTATTTSGDPTLKPQTADTFEMLLGARPLEGLHLTGNVFYTKAEDIVTPLLEKAVVLNRNADISVSGAELAADFRYQDFLSGFANVSFLFHSGVTPKRLPNESEAAWQYSPVNTTVPVGAYPDWLINAGLNAQAKALHLNVGVDVHYVGARRASLVTNQTYEPLDLARTYELPAYLLVNATVSTTGLKLLGERETVFSLRLAGIPGGYVEPGYGGIDIPSLGPRVHFRLQQEF